MANPKERKILWAMDAFAEDEVLDRKTAHILKAWASASSPSIEPVTVLSPDQLKMPSTFFSDQSEDVVEHVTKELNTRVGKLGVPGLKEPKVLISVDVSLRNAVDKLIHHAKKWGAELIVISSHSQKSVSHFLFGSFAETLVLQSDVPVFIVTPRMHEIRKVEHIFFPTDLSAAARTAMEEVLPIARDWNARLTLFHKVDFVTRFTLPSFQTGSLYADYLAEDVAWRKRELGQWAEDARKTGVEVDVKVDETSGKGIWESILERVAHLNGVIIAMASQTGPVSSAILGSTTRQVIRQATCPLWVIHPRRTE